MAWFVVRGSQKLARKDTFVCKLNVDNWLPHDWLRLGKTATLRRAPFAVVELKRAYVPHFFFNTLTTSTLKICNILFD